MKEACTPLRLKINETKSAVVSALGRKFLGHSLWIAKGREVKLAAAKKAVRAFKQWVRKLTWRSGGRSLAEVVERLRSYLLGWTAYFGLAQTPGVWMRLDEWLRHRLRAVPLKHWKRGTTMFCELRALGASRDIATQVAANARRWWFNSAKLVHHVLMIAYFDSLGVPRFSCPQLHEPPGADPHAGWCGRGAVNTDCPLYRL
jgi:RNA-directed DNA polymerase